MSNFSFIHAADLHLGSPFQSLAIKNDSIASRFAQATRIAFTRLVDHAIAQAVDFVLIAGDVYDREWKDNAIGLFFNREVARLARAGIPVVFLNGNHDAQSVVTRSVPLPESVIQLPTDLPGTILLENLAVAIHGQGFSERNTTENLTLRYPPASEGRFNIGMLHTALTGRPPHDSYAPCSLDDLVSRGYDYWALGHVHEFEVVERDPHIVFPGNLQGRSIRETGEKGAVLVRVEDRHVASVDRVILDEARWLRVSVAVDDCAENRDVHDRVLRSLANQTDLAIDKLFAIRVELTGTCEIHRSLLAERSTLFDEIQAELHHLHSDAWLEKLEIHTKPARTTNPSGSGSSIDFETMIQDASGDLKFQDEMDAILRTIAAKLPGGIGAQEDPLGAPEDLISEARALIAVRADAADRA